MAKANVNTASRDELVEAGVRAELADEILKLRRKGQISPEALDEVPGVGPATLEQLRQALDFSDKGGGGNGDDRGQQRERERERGQQERGGGGGRGAEEAGRKAGEEVAAAARGATRAGAEATAEAARGGLQVVRRTAEAAGEAQRELAQRSAEGTAELGRALVELVQEQARRNVETLQALAGAVDWERIARIQEEYLRASLERAAGWTQRYLEVSQAVMTAAAGATRDQARKAA